MPNADQISDSQAATELLRRHRDALSGLSQFTAAPGIVTQNECFYEVASRIAHALQIDYVKVLRYRVDVGSFLLSASVGWDETASPAEAPPADFLSPERAAFLTAEAVKIEDIDANHGYHLQLSLRDKGITSLLATPILVSGSPWGVIEVGSAAPRHFDADTMAFLVAAANELGVVVQRMGAERAQAEAISAAAREVQKRALLLAEMQHRVKNNFQTILALMTLQGKSAATPESRAMMRQLEDKIFAMSLAHEQLSITRTDERLDMGAYLRALVSAIEKPFEGLFIEVDASQMTLDIDQAVPLGLIVNEAITNAVKHAFGAGGGKIHIELAAHGRDAGLLSICDDGDGGDPSSVFNSGSGLKLMNALARQLRGTVEWRGMPQGGVMVCVIFPLSQASLGEGLRQISEPDVAQPHPGTTPRCDPWSSNDGAATGCAAQT